MEDKAKRARSGWASRLSRAIPAALLMLSAAGCAGRGASPSSLGEPPVVERGSAATTLAPAQPASLGATPTTAPLPTAQASPTTAPLPTAQASPTTEPTPIPGVDGVGRVDLLPRDVRQGHTVILKVWTSAAQSVSATIEGRELPLVKHGDAWIGFFAFHRMARPGPRPVQLTLVDAAGRRTVRNDPADTLRVIDAAYPTESIVVGAGTLALLDPNKVNQEEAFLNGIYGKWTPERAWNGPFVAPAAGAEITSEFGTKRSINGGPANWAHEGTDFDVQEGEFIQAAAAGKVVFSGPLHVRGNSVVVDHGWGVMTGYFHMSKIQVQIGQEVAGGTILGLVGTTGFVTGPHLHFEVRVQNVNVEPLEWLNKSPFQRQDLVSL